MVIPGAAVHEAEKFMARCRFYQLIDPPGGKAILWTNFMEVSEVDVGPPLVILLHEDGIGEPVGVECLSDEVACSRRST